MRTARSLTVCRGRSVCQGGVCGMHAPPCHAPPATHTPCHACPPHMPLLPCMPPTTHTPPTTHMPPLPCTPCPATHAPPPHNPPAHDPHHHVPPHAPCHACHPPPVDRILDTRFWKYYLVPTSLRAVKIRSQWKNTEKRGILCLPEFGDPGSPLNSFYTNMRWIAFFGWFSFQVHPTEARVRPNKSSRI